MITLFLLQLPAQILNYLIAFFPDFTFVSTIFDALGSFLDVLYAFDFMIPVSDIIAVFSVIVLLWTAVLVYKVLLFIYSFIRGGIHFKI